VDSVVYFVNSYHWIAIYQALVVQRMVSAIYQKSVLLTYHGEVIQRMDITVSTRQFSIQWVSAVKTNYTVQQIACPVESVMNALNDWSLKCSLLMIGSIKLTTGFVLVPWYTRNQYNTASK